jgi:hypothetical protein
MASDYGLCCMGAECCMPNKTVTFHHCCIRCSGFLHIVCGVTDNDDDTACKKCLGSNRPTVGMKSPQKAVISFLEAQNKTTMPNVPTGSQQTYPFWKRRIRQRCPMFPLDHNKRIRSLVLVQVELRNC